MHCFADLGMGYKGGAVCKKANSTTIHFIVNGEN